MTCALSTNGHSCSSSYAVSGLTLHSRPNWADFQRFNYLEVRVGDNTAVGVNGFTLITSNQVARFNAC